MAQKPVAVASDVSATAGTGLVDGADSGTWTPGPVQCQSHAKLQIGGAETVWQATCNYVFSGLSSSGVGVPGASSVTLTASATKLQGGGSNVLRDGDENSDEFGNKLSVSASGKLQSA
jgi:hypothetical protein